MKPIVHWCAYEDDLASRGLDKIFTNHQSELPNWRHIVILVPNANVRPSLMRLLQRINLSGVLIPPYIGTLRSYIEQHCPTDNSIINDEQRRLILVDEIRRHHAIFPNASPWSLSNALFELFDELTLNQVTLSKHLDDFIKSLELGYGVSHSKLNGLNIEAQAVHTLWLAYHQQLAAFGEVDANSAYCLRLNHWKNENHRFYIFDVTQWLPSERVWLSNRVSEERVEIFLHGDAETSPFRDESIQHPIESAPQYRTNFSAFLSEIFAKNEVDFATRARNFSERLKQSPALGRLFIFNADNFEMEARAIELQIRRWIIAGKNNIALVIENRTLARRVRALLERANVSLRDSSGWALSTTSAAAVVESWLQTIEEDYAHGPLLDVLKSPFSVTGQKELEVVYALESDIMQFENIARGLNRYRQAVSNRFARLEIETSNTTTQLIGLLDLVEHAAQPLIDLRTGKSAPVSTYLDALGESIHRLEIDRGFATDAAGIEVLNLLHSLQVAVENLSISLEWTEFRTWFAQSLEEHRFAPESDLQQATRIELLNLMQCSLGRYDALILGGLTRDYLPGAVDRSPFFNASVRSTLNLPSHLQIQQEKFHRFRSVLESSETILLTYQHDESSNVPSPWLELIHEFHQIAYRESLTDQTLTIWLRTPTSEVCVRDRPLPLSEERASVKLNARQLPKEISASSHQSLINCPYAFFAGSTLKLKAPEEIREILSKHDYGERVHTCLQAFHKGLDGFPGPFPFAIVEANRDSAIEFLENITRRVFATDIEDSFHHRGWMNNWLVRIPNYIDWQISKSVAGWHVEFVEKYAKHPINSDLSVYGRIDRVDQRLEARAILDYKTGTIPSRGDIETGESVQLAHYALAVAEPVTAIEYVDLHSETIVSKHCLDGESLVQVVQNVRDRLLAIWQDANNEQAFIAWGDEKTCRFCRFIGLCRKGTWS